MTFVAAMSAGGPNHFWLILHHGEAKLCPEHPGLEEDLRVAASVTGLYDLFHGRVTLGGAISSGPIQIDGPPRLKQSFPIWFRVRP